MAASPGSMSLEELTEELDLHKALLQSLLETHPDAVEDAIDLRTTINQFERELAQRRGLPLSDSPRTVTASSQPQSQSSRSLPDSFANDLRLGHPPRNPLSQSRTVSYRESPLSTPRRERPSAPDSLSGTSSSRMASRPNSPSGSMDPFDHIDHIDENDDDDDYLNRLLGIDDAFKEGQYEAEKWLEERREQEREDEEFARRLQSQWEESVSGPTNESPGRVPSDWSTNLRDIAARLSSGNTNIPPPYGSYQINRPGPVSDAASNMSALPFHPRNSTHTPSQFSYNDGNMPPPTPTQNGPGMTTADSSDSDVAEISANEFRARPQYARLPIHALYPTQWPSTKVPHQPPTSLQTTRDILNTALLNTVDQAKRMGLQNFPAFNSALHSYNRYASRNPAFLLSSLSLFKLANSSSGDIYDSQKAQIELKEMLENLRPDAELSKDKWEGTPQALQFPLLDHQKLGLTWMKSMEEGHNKGGILADDMGLGKTMQAIALMVSRPPPDSSIKTTLIVAPVALMEQWGREIDRMIRPGFKLKTFIYHGSKRAASFDKLRTYDVVLTTFGTLASELKRKEEWENRRRFAGQNRANVTAEASSLLLLGPNSSWYRVIIDEAQCIKNRKTKASIACCSLNSTYRWCMSGTPMMNNVGELHSLLKFLRIRPYDSLELFTKVSMSLVYSRVEYILTPISSHRTF